MFYITSGNALRNRLLWYDQQITIKINIKKMFIRVGSKIIFEQTTSSMRFIFGYTSVVLIVNGSDEVSNSWKFLKLNHTILRHSQTKYVFETKIFLTFDVRSFRTTTYSRVTLEYRFIDTLDRYRKTSFPVDLVGDTTLAIVLWFLFQ